MAREFSIYVTTYQGLEEILLEELQMYSIGNKHEIRKRGVAFIGSLKDIYLANLQLRTALRVLINLESFSIHQVDDLYQMGKQISWKKWFDSDKTLAIDTVVRSPLFKNKMYAAQLLKDAICDHFVQNGMERPYVDLRTPQIKVHLLIAGDKCTISMDSSGDSLHKRGYKMATGVAPISEVLAAGILKIANKNSSHNIYDAMCGSGTILCEAALMEQNIAPGKYRSHYCFRNWLFHDRSIWQKVIDQTEGQGCTAKHQIKGSDIHGLAVKDSRQNLASIDVSSIPSVEKLDFFDSKAPYPNGLLVMNPPYDKRIPLHDAQFFYKRIGDKLKKDYKGWSAAIFSANIPALKALGLKPSRRFPLWNGPLEGRLFLYDLY